MPTMHASKQLTMQTPCRHPVTWAESDHPSLNLTIRPFYNPLSPGAIDSTTVISFPTWLIDLILDLRHPIASTTDTLPAASRSLCHL